MLSAGVCIAGDWYPSCDMLTFVLSFSGWLIKVSAAGEWSEKKKSHTTNWDVFLGIWLCYREEYEMALKTVTTLHWNPAGEMNLTSYQHPGDRRVICSVFVEPKCLAPPTGDVCSFCHGVLESRVGCRWTFHSWKWRYSGLELSLEKMDLNIVWCWGSFTCTYQKQNKNSFAAKGQSYYNKPW